MITASKNVATDISNSLQDALNKILPELKTQVSIGVGRALRKVDVVRYTQALVEDELQQLMSRSIAKAIRRCATKTAEKELETVTVDVVEKMFKEWLVSLPNKKSEAGG